MMYIWCVDDFFQNMKFQLPFQFPVNQNVGVGMKNEWKKFKKLIGAAFSWITGTRHINSTWFYYQVFFEIYLGGFVV